MFTWTTYSYPAAKRVWTDSFIEHIAKKAGWKMETEGQLKDDVGDEFMYLKRKCNVTRDGIIVRPDP